jgi:hypothetical protein
MFFFKRSKIVVDCFTTQSAINELFPIQKASKFYPDWWKNLPKTFNRTNSWGLSIPQSTMKACNGFINMYQNGFMIPLWSDLIVETSHVKWLYEFSAPSEIHSHDPEQLGNIGDTYHHLKLISPWIFREKTGIKFTWMASTYNQIDRLQAYHVLPGIMDYKYNCGTNINLLFPKVVNKQLIKAGTPLVHIIPMSENPVEVKTHVITEQELHKLETNSYISTFIRKYDTNKKILKDKERSCPFGK